MLEERTDPFTGGPFGSKPNADSSGYRLFILLESREGLAIAIRAADPMNPDP